MSQDPPTSRVARLLARLQTLPAGRFWVLPALWAVLSHLPLAATDLLNADEGGWWLGARIWLGGGVPYLDFVDNKPPLIYAIYALPQMLGIESLYGAHALALVWMSATGYLVGLLAAELAPLGAERERGAVRLIALLYVGLGAMGPSRQFLPLNTEHAGMLPMVAGMLLYSRARLGRRPNRNLVLAGALVALAGLIRQSLWFALPLLAIEMLWPGTRDERADDDPAAARAQSLETFARWGLFGLGFVFVCAGMMLYLAANNALGEALYWIVTANQEAIAAAPPLSYHLKRFSKNVLPSLALCLPLWVLALRGMRAECWAGGVRFRLAALWVAAALVALWAGSLGGRWLGHYYIPVLAPLTSVAGARLVALLARDNKRGTLGARLGSTALILVMVGALAFGTGNLVRTARGSYEEAGPVLEAAATRIRALTSEDDPVFIWGFGQALYYKARREPANRFIAPNTQISGYLFGAEQAFENTDREKLVDPEQFAHFMADLERGKPKLFLDYAENNFHYFGRHNLDQFPTLHRWLSQNYRRLPDQGPIVFYERIGN